MLIVRSVSSGSVPGRGGSSGASGRGDLTARAAILDAALHLFAERGEDATSVRAIAEAAEVSPALVLHHFGSKAGLREAVVDRVRQVMDDVLEETSGVETAAEVTGGEWGGIGETIARAFPAGSPVPAYLRRLLLTGDPMATDLLRRQHARTVEIFQHWHETGLMDLGPDPAVRAALLMIADYGLLLMREQWAEVLGADPVGEGMQRVAEDALRIYASVWNGPPEGAAPPPSASPPDSVTPTEREDTP